MKPIVFVTGNQGKADKLARVLGVSIDHRKLDLTEIQSMNLREIAEYKARQAYEITQSPVIVDDVSLEFAAMGGLPGPFVKYFVEHAGLEGMIAMLAGFDDKSAVARAGICYCDENGPVYFEGSLKGVIADKPRGENGFGWDRLFIPDGYGGRTRAELDDNEYDAVYQRLRPTEQLRTFLESRDS